MGEEIVLNSVISLHNYCCLECDFCSIHLVFIFDWTARWLRGLSQCRQLCHWGHRWLVSQRQLLTPTPSSNFDLV